MKRLLFLMVLTGGALAGCSPVTRPQVELPSTPETRRCEAPIADLIGKPFTPALSADAKTRSGATTVRVIRPGMAVTMDYRSDRLNIELDERDVVTKLGCS